MCNCNCKKGATLSACKKHLRFMVHKIDFGLMSQESWLYKCTLLAVLILCASMLEITILIEFGEMTKFFNW